MLQFLKELRLTVIEYRVGNKLDLDKVIELYRASTLSERRPVDEHERMGEMLRNANLVITAWDGNLLVGISRSVSDFAYCTYHLPVGSCGASVTPAAGHRQGTGPAHQTGIRPQDDRNLALGAQGRGLLSAHRLHATSFGVDSALRPPPSFCRGPDRRRLSLLRRRH